MNEHHPHADADVLIAATALEHGRVLVTGNTAHFSWIPGLAIEDWRQPWCGDPPTPITWFGARHGAMTQLFAGGETRRWIDSAIAATRDLPDDSAISPDRIPNGLAL
jgi:hypothetical protein